MVNFLQITILAANGVILLYYGQKWVKIRSMYRKIEEAHDIPLLSADLAANAGNYVFLTGTVKSLGEALHSKYSNSVSAVVQNIQKISHQVVRIGGFWVRKRAILESVQCHHGKMALFNAAGDLKVDIRDPLWGLKQASDLDLFTGYRNVSWPVSNIFYDSFTVKAATSPLKIFLNGVNEIGVQETESLILDGGHLSVLGHLRVKGGEYSILVDLLTACDRTMLLKKVSDIRAEVATKIIIFGTLAIVLGLIFFRKSNSRTNYDDDF